MVEHTGTDAGPEPGPAPEVQPKVGPDPAPDQAWKALGLVNDWIKHADAKVGATLAANGAAGVMLYNLVKNETAPGFWLSVVTVACTAAIIATGGAGTLALIPRLSIVSKHRTRKAQKARKKAGTVPLEVREDPVNLLFFSNIARHYTDDGPSYVEVLRSMTADPEELTRQIAHQVHANATVAHRKFTWADKAIKSLAVAFGLLGIIAVIVGLNG